MGGNTTIQASDPVTKKGGKTLNQTDGSLHTKSSSGSVWAYGSWPNTLFLPNTTTTTAAAALTINNIQAYKTGTVVISGLNTETIAVTGLNGQANAIDLSCKTSAGVLQAASALGNGTFHFEHIVTKDLVFTKSAAVDSVTIDVDLKAV